MLRRHLVMHYGRVISTAQFLATMFSIYSFSIKYYKLPLELGQRTRVGFPP